MKSTPALLILCVSAYITFFSIRANAQNPEILNCNMAVVYQGANAKALYAPGATIPSSTPVNVILTLNLADTINISKVHVKLISPNGGSTDTDFNYSAKFTNNGNNNYFTQTLSSMMFGLGNMLLSDVAKVETTIEYTDGQSSDLCLSLKP